MIVRRLLLLAAAVAAPLALGGTDVAGPGLWPLLSAVERWSGVALAALGVAVSVGLIAWLTSGLARELGRLPDDRFRSALVLSALAAAWLTPNGGIAGFAPALLLAIGLPERRATWLLAAAVTAALADPRLAMPAAVVLAYTMRRLADAAFAIAANDNQPGAVPLRRPAMLRLVEPISSAA